MVDREVELKFILLGTVNSGKSSLVERIKYGPDARTLQYLSTIGIDFCVFNKYITHNEFETKYTTHLWDAGGNKNFINIVRSFFNRVTGTLVLYDISSIDSFHGAKEYIEEFKKFNKYYSYIFLIGNKLDLERNVSYEDGKDYADSIDALFIECSVKENRNIEKIFDILFKKINIDLQNNTLIPNSDNQVKIYHPLKIRESSTTELLQKSKKNICCNIQ